MTLAAVLGRDPEPYLLPGHCGPCGAPLVLLPPFTPIETPNGRVLDHGGPGWRWLEPASGSVHVCR